MEATNALQLNHPPFPRPLDRPTVWCILLQRQMCPNCVVISGVAAENALQMAFSAATPLTSTVGANVSIFISALGMFTMTSSPTTYPPDEEFGALSS